MGTGRLFALTLATVAALAVSGLAQEAAPQNAPIVVFFYQEGCPDCVRIGEVLDALASELPEGAIARYEIGTPEVRKLFRKLQKAYEIEVSTVPVVFIGNRAIVGASLPRQLELTDAIGDCITGSCASPLDRLPPDVFPWRDVLELGLFASLVVLLTLLQLP